MLSSTLRKCDNLFCQKYGISVLIKEAWIDVRKWYEICRHLRKTWLLSRVLPTVRLSVRLSVRPFVRLSEFRLNQWICRQTFRPPKIRAIFLPGQPRPLPWPNFSEIKTRDKFAVDNVLVLNELRRCIWGLITQWRRPSVRLSVSPSCLGPQVQIGNSYKLKIWWNYACVRESPVWTERPRSHCRMFVHRHGGGSGGGRSSSSE